jgi:hypothetical protein
MNSVASSIRAAEKDRWWLVWISILCQQVFFLQLPIFTAQLHAPSAAVMIIWLMSFVMPLAYLKPVSGKAYFRSLAKIGWLYVLAAFAAAMCAVFYLAFGQGDLFTKLQLH